MVQFAKVIKRIFRMILRFIVFTAAAGILIFGLPRLASGLYSIGRIASVDSASQRPVAIVFGAGLLRDGSPTPVLRDRVETAADLYFTGKFKSC